MKMKFLNIIFVSAVMVAAASCAKVSPVTDAPAATSPEETVPAYMPGEVVLKFDESLGDLLDEAGLADAPATRSGVSTVDEILDIIDGYRLERVFPVNKATEEASRAAGLHLWYVVHFSEDENVEDVVKKLSALGEVQSAAPVRTIKKAYDGKVIPFRSSAATRAITADQDLLPWQWNLKNNGYDGGNNGGNDGVTYTVNPDLSSIKGYPFGGRNYETKFVQGDDVHWEQARALCQGDPSIIVAVLDEGVFLEHPDLVNSLWTNEDEVEYSNEDHDGNGYAGDVHGYDFLNDRGYITWDDVNDTGHGTHCAGIIAATNGNNGISSIAGPDNDNLGNSGVRIMSCQIFSGRSASTTVSLSRAIKYAADNGAVVLQCSFGYTSGAANPYEYGIGYRDADEWEASSPLEKAAMDYFIHNAGSDNGPVKGGIPVFASGNEYAPMAGFPGAYEGCVSVAAVAGDFTPSTYTNYAEYTKISAPGGDQDYYFDFKEPDGGRGAVGCILSTLPFHVSDSGYGYMEGTSMACPHVSGVIALGLSHAARLHKHFTADEIIDMLYKSATSIDDDMTGTKFYYRWQVDVPHLIHARTMSLSSYKNNMGAGVVNAEAFLGMIAGDDAGVAMEFPNIYIKVGASSAANPVSFLGQGPFSVTIDDPSVASVSADGKQDSASGTVSNAEGTLTFFGLKSGSTTATITYAGGSQTFAITVRTSSDWL